MVPSDYRRADGLEGGFGDEDSDVGSDCDQGNFGGRADDDQGAVGSEDSDVGAASVPFHDAAVRSHASEGLRPGGAGIALFGLLVEDHLGVALEPGRRVGFVDFGSEQKIIFNQVGFDEAEMCRNIVHFLRR